MGNCRSAVQLTAPDARWRLPLRRTAASHHAAMRSVLGFMLHITALLVGGLATAAWLEPAFADVLIAFLRTANGVIVATAVVSIFVLCPFGAVLHWWRIFRRAREISYNTDAGRISVSLIAIEEALTRAIEGESDVKKATVRVFEDRVKRSVVIEAVVTLWEVSNVTERNRFCQRLLRRRFAELMPEQTVVQVNLTVHRLNQRRDEPRAVKPATPVLVSAEAPAESVRPTAHSGDDDYRPAPPIGVELATSEEDLYVGPTYPVLRDDEEENGSSTQTYFQRPGQTKPQSPRKR